MQLIKEWIEPGTLIISDCGKAYDRIGQEGYDNLTVNHSYNFVCPETGAHTNKIETTWRHIKAKIPEYNRQGGWTNYLAMFLFSRMCSENNENVFNNFMEILREIRWSEKLFRLQTNRSK